LVADQLPRGARVAKAPLEELHLRPAEEVARLGLGLGAGHEELVAAGLIGMNGMYS